MRADLSGHPRPRVDREHRHRPPSGRPDPRSHRRTPAPGVRGMALWGPVRTAQAQTHPVWSRRGGGGGGARTQVKLHPDGGEVIKLRRTDLDGTRIQPADDEPGFKLQIRKGKKRKTWYEGSEALRFAGTILPRLNETGGNRQTVQNAVDRDRSRRAPRALSGRRRRAQPLLRRARRAGLHQPDARSNQAGRRITRNQGAASQRCQPSSPRGSLRSGRLTPPSANSSPPRNGALMAILASAGVRYEAWPRHVLPLYLGLVALGLVAIAVAVGL